MAVEPQILIKKLKEFVSPERSERIHQVVQNRTRMIRVVIEDIHSDRNAGALFRTCDCFGVQEAFVIETEYKSRVSEIISQGSDKWLDVTHYDDPEEDNTVKCLERVKNDGYTIVATTPHDHDVELPEFKIQEKTAFLFGTEEEGLTDTALKMSDLRLKVPIYGFSESYNISVSAALILQHTVEQLRRSNQNWRLTPEEQMELEIKWIVKAIGPAGESLYKKFTEGK